MKEFKSTNYKKLDFYKNVSKEDWNNWKWQLANVIKDVKTLKKVAEIDDDEEKSINKCLEKFTMAITPYYASLMEKGSVAPVRAQAIPSSLETIVSPEDDADPLHEDVDSPVPGLTHRYPDRVLLLVTQICSMNCRHCTRRRLVGDVDQHVPMKRIDKCIEYIANHTEVRDVLISGGDPLTLDDNTIDMILTKIRKIPHVEIVRLGSRMPVVLPQRITDEFCEMLKKHHPIYLNTHFNHPNELTLEAKIACEKLADAGIPLGNQSVLLNGVNNEPTIMKELVHGLLKIRVKPYYIYVCDLSVGISHFRTPVSEGINIIEHLRGHTTGMAVPTFVVDAPGGGGKTPVMPQYIISSNKRKVILRNYEGVITTYTEPSQETYKAQKYKTKENPAYRPIGGVAKILDSKNDEPISMSPSDLARLKRHK